MTPGELILALPLVVDPWGFHRFVALRYAAATTLVAVGLWRARSAPLPSTPVRAAWLALLTVLGAAAVLAHDVPQALLGDPVRMMGLAGWVLVAGAWALGALSSSGVALVRVRDLLVASATAASIVAIAQAGNGTLRPGGSMGNAAFLGAVICLAAPAAVHASLDAWGARRFVFFAAAALMLVAGVLAQARGAALGTTIGIAVLLGVRGRRAMALGLVTVGVVAVLAVPLERTTAQGRIDTWRETMAVVADRPVLGWGPEGFRAGFARHVSGEWVRTYELRQIPDRAHNAVLDIAVAGGVMGAAAYVALWGAAAAALWRRRADALSLSLGAGVVAYAVQAQFSFDAFDTAAMTWFVVGVVTGPPAALRSVKGKATPGLARAATAGALVVVAVLALASDRVIAAASGQPPGRAFGRLGWAARLWPHSFDAGVLAATVASADDELAGQADRRFGEWPDPYVRLAVARALGDEEALEELRTELPTNPQLYLALGAARLRASDGAGARDAYLEAIRLAPVDAEGRTGLAAALFTLGADDDACEALAEAIVRTDPDERESLAAQRRTHCG